MAAPNLRELAFILLVGALQPMTELFLGARVAAGYNILAAFVVLLYLGYQVVKNPSLVKAWGLRLDTVAQSVPLYLAFTAIASVLIYLAGHYLGHTPLPLSFWYLLLIYPVWGIAQQFALQNLVAQNLTGIAPHLYGRALVTAAIFSLAHAPSVELMVVTALAGFVFTVLYNRAPNLLVLGCSHGFLGALVFYLILGQDQWAILHEYLQ
jgi:hypothetical protein